MKITKKVSPTQGKPGDQATYTVTVTNIGKTTLTGATFTDDLTGVLDDATYNNDGATTAGTVSYTAPKLTWTGNLPIGTTATVTYSVRINSPDTGDHQLINVITSTTPGTNCPSPDCGTTTPVPGIEIVKQASATQAKPGDRIAYTVTVTNTGRTAQLGATFTDDLTGVLDDATYNQDGSATLGGVGYAAPKLTWTGDIPVGGSATITYSVTVSNPDTGDHSLNNVITSTTPGNNCPCTTTTPVAGMRIVKQATPTQVDPNGTVTYTITVTNTGKTILTGATFTDNLTGVLDDATYNNDGTATTGAIAYTAPNLTWTGDLAIGSSATVTYSVLVNKTGDHRLNNTITSTTPGTNCPSPDCTTSTPVSGVRITKTASASTANPGDRITYTVTVTNTGQTTLNATFTDNLTNVLDDATYNNDAPATVTYTAPNLTWTGTLAIGASTTITYSVQVNKPDTGDHKLTNVVTSTTPGNNCGCTTTTPVSGLTITKQADKTKVLPGEKITYTVTVTNTGQTVQTGATFTDDLTQVLDDAGYDNDASATIGTTTYAAPHLTWTGDLPIGASATVTYSVTVYDPDTGDKKLVNRITSTTPGTNCDLNSKDPRCTTQTPSPSLRITKKANTTEANPGDKITYTITVLNNGQLDLTNTTITDDLTQVLDEATYNNDASATTGSITYAAPTLTWTGDLKIGADATITYTVTVHDPITGDHELRNAVSSDTPGSNCPPQSTDPACTNTVLLPGMQITKTATPTHADPGSTVTYTIVVTNTGKTTLTTATFTDNLTNVLDDATYNNDATGTATYTAPNLTWTGILAVGASATITYSVKVNNPDTGDHKLTNVVTSTTPGTNCDCTTTTPVSGLTITKKASTTESSPGDKVTYTVTVTNTGQTVQTGATFTDNLTNVLDDATYNADATTTLGVVTYAPPNLTWTGTLPIGATATITYAVRINSPDPGDHQLTNVATTTTPGTNCDCTTTIPVSSLVITKKVSTTQANPGDKITYTVTVTNTGQSPITGATFTDNLTNVLDDATYNNDATGSVTYTAPNLTWTGILAVGASATITYSVRINNPDNGDHQLTNVVTSTTPGNNCTPCTTTTPVAGLTITKKASAATATSGDKVTYTVTVINTGQTVQTGATFTDDLTKVLDDATYNNDATATVGTTSYTKPKLTWTGDLPIGSTARITYSVLVNKPDTGDHKLTNVVTSTNPGDNCPPGNTDPRCTTTTSITPPPPVPPTPAPPQPLAFTGVVVYPVVGIGLLLLLLGCAAVRYGRRRSTR
jgi:uncharacterized repeat protein (TIGR01451 family)